MTVSTEMVCMAKSRSRKNQSERSDLLCHIIMLIVGYRHGMIIVMQCILIGLRSSTLYNGQWLERADSHRVRSSIRIKNVFLINVCSTCSCAVIDRGRDKYGLSFFFVTWRQCFVELHVQCTSTVNMWPKETVSLIPC